MTTGIAFLMGMRIPWESHGNKNKTPTRGMGTSRNKVMREKQLELFEQALKKTERQLNL